MGPAVMSGAGTGGPPWGGTPARHRTAAARAETRDRDAAGRPRNARPRDATGRPLPRDAGTPAAPPDPPALPPAEALAEADRLVRAHRPFAAHEVLEAAWKAAPPAERDFWQGLAQLAVGLTHLQRGNSRGAGALLRRGAGRLTGGDPKHGVDIARLVGSALELAQRVADGTADPVGAAALPWPLGG